MPIPIPLPLAPLAGAGASAAASTFIAGSSLKLAQSLYGFQRSIPTLPPLTGLEGVATLQDLISDALAGARVPVASLPNPLGPNGSLAGAIAAAAAVGMWAEREKIKNGLLELGKLLGIQNANTAQRWGLLGGPNITGRDGPIVTSSGNWNPNGLNEIRWSGYWVGNDYLGRPVRTNGFTNSNMGIVTGPFAVRIKTGNSYEASLCSSATEISCGYYPPGGLVDNKPINWTGFMGSFKFTVLSGGPGYPVPSDAVTGNPPIELVPWIGAPSFDDGSFLEAELPQAISLPQATQSSQPFSDSSAGVAQGAQQVVPVQPGPSRPAVPAVSPATPPTIAPWLLPGAIPATQTRTDGSLVPAAAPPVVATDPGSIIPWPGATAIPGTGPAPAPTLQGIAQEVGRIERKLEVMNNPTAPGNLIDRFGDLANLISPLIEAIMAISSGTTYTLDSPCELDAEGVKLPAVVVQAPGAFNQFGAILNRVDALAELLQVHKDLKQPNCRQKPPVGEFVTVNFEEIS
jgi:hypothetical protein